MHPNTRRLSSERQAVGEPPQANAQFSYNKAYADHEESQEIKRLNAEISKALNTVSFDKEAIKQKMFTCVSEKFTSLGTEEITAQSLKDIFKTVPPLTAYDSDLTDQAVSEIQLKETAR